MALSDEWLFPRVGGDLYQDKPPLFFWLLAICYTLFGSVKASFLIPVVSRRGRHAVPDLRFRPPHW